MMSGIEHFREAERYLDVAWEATSNKDFAADQTDVDILNATIASAQVHATLALVAAQAEAHPRAEWREALS